MAALSSFEVLAERLVPDNILPPDAPNPFALQGYWVQISVAPGAPQQRFNLIFQETTDFTQGAGRDALMAQVIGPDGQVNLYPDFFASTGRGFLSQAVYPGNTVIYGIQAIPPMLAAQTPLPQNGTGWRGSVRIEGQQPGSLIATPTQRLVYYSGPSITKDTVINATVYAVPTASGGTQI